MGDGPVCRALSTVQAHTELFAGFEERNCLARDFHPDAGAWVTAGTGGAMLEPERPEIAQLDTIAPGQGGGDFLE